jgi:hypothetical protein
VRSPQEQDEFLERGRFGEGDEARNGVHRLVWIGLLSIVAGGTCLGAAVLFQIGRDDGGPFLIIGMLVGVVVGITCIIIGLVRMRSR